MEIARGIYKHYKGKLYLVEGIAIRSGKEDLADQEPIVVYRPLYDNYGMRWRPLSEFIGQVEDTEFIYAGQCFVLVQMF